MYKERLKGLTAKIESTRLTDALPAIGTDGIQLDDHIWSVIEIGYMEDNLRENLAQAGLGRAGTGAPGGRYGHITVTFPIRGCTAAFADAGPRPDEDVLLRICGLQATVDESVGTETVTYTPRSEGHETATVYAYSSGSLYKMVGCQATLTGLRLTPNTYMQATIDIWGAIIDDPTDVAHPTIVYPQKSITPPVVQGAAFSMNGYTFADFMTCTLETRTTLVPLPRGNAAGGHFGYEITDYNPHLMATVDKVALSSFNPYELHQNGTLFAISFGPIGTTQYNRLSFACSSARMVNVPHSAQDGLPMWDLEARLQNTDEETPDDAFTLTYS